MCEAALLTLCEPGCLACLVLSHLVHGVLAALGILAVGVPLLGDVHLSTKRVQSAAVTEGPQGNGKPKADP